MILAAFLPILAMLQAPAELKERAMQLVYLVEAENPPKLTKDAEQTAQAAHLKRLEDFWTTRRAVMVGPFADGGRIKGIVLFDLPRSSEAVALMDEDPWVKAGQLKPVVRSVTVPTGIIQKGPRFLDLDSLWFCETTETNNGSRRAVSDHRRLLDEHEIYAAKLSNIALRCRFSSGDDHRDFMVLRGKEREAVEKVLNNDPAVAGGVLQIELHPFLVSKGTFPDDK